MLLLMRDYCIQYFESRTGDAMKLRVTRFERRASFVIHRLKVTPYGAWPAIGMRKHSRFSD